MAQGFTWRYNLSGGAPLIKSFIMKDTETLTKGDLVNIETGEADLAATADAALAGVVLGPTNPSDATEGTPGVVAGTDSTTPVDVIINPDAVYADPDDTNARQPGALLDISGATGAQALAASSNNEFVVVERKFQTADETHVMILNSAHYLTVS
tara:strand:- start:2876 stop:3337 length:462 start_codon:yes stop_codon:yes gene_type:complete